MNESGDAELSRWGSALRHAGGGRLAHVEVLTEVDSTQDHLRRRGCPPWTVVAALRQSAGRGRLDRKWVDDRGEGVAISMTMPATRASVSSLDGGAAPHAAAARLMMIAGLAALAAVDAALGARPRGGGASDAAFRDRARSGLKWPNDVLVGPRKIAGVLVEMIGDVAGEQRGATGILGIGINVLQRSFEGELAHRATSLALLGADSDRCAVAADVVRSFVEHCELDLTELVARFQRHDLLRGTRCTFETLRGRVEGEVLEIDPLRVIRVRGADGAVVDIHPSVATVVR